MGGRRRRLPPSYSSAERRARAFQYASAAAHRTRKTLAGDARSRTPPWAIRRLTRIDVYYTADTTEETTQGTVIGRGHVQVNYQGYVVTGNQAELDTNKGTATFEGPVHLIGPTGQTADVGADGRLRFNLNRGTYTLTGSRSVIQPEQVQVPIGIIEPIYLLWRRRPRPARLY